MKKVLGIFRSIVFLGWLCAALLAASLALGAWAMQMAVTVATMSAAAATTAAAHRKELARAVAKAKAKARLRHVIVALPFVGGAAIVYFENQNYQEWKEENPSGTRSDYLCEMAELTAEVMDDVLQGLPERLRPNPELLLSRTPACIYE